MAWPADGGWRHLTKRITRGKIHLVTKCMVDGVGSTLQGSIPSKRTEARDAFHDIVGFFISLENQAFGLTYNLVTYGTKLNNDRSVMKQHQSVFLWGFSCLIEAATEPYV